ncbi:Signal peptidase complex catalytic subunit [Cerrena zonata]|uniref:Signal peptidase complex catalytic subunit SEC11 n=1 Tax=Cerrena zonata TaxID=2478898 RepID=A0AAW0FG22_9APHY
MEPAFQRGDILFLWNRDSLAKVGDVVVYEIQGDNNAVDDLGLYAKKQPYLNQKTDLVGTVKGYLPKLGYVTILITENVYFKYGLLGIMGISSLLSNE